MRTFLAFLAAYTLSQFYRSFLAVIAPELSVELGLDPQALGNLQAFWIWGFVLMQVPVGWALDTIGPRRTTAGLMLAAVAGALVFAGAQSALALNLAMALIGVGCSAIYMGGLYLFGRVYPMQRFVLMASWLLGIGTAGNLLAATPLAWAVVAIGWRGAMLGMAGATVLSALAIFLLVRDPPRLGHQASSGFLAGIVAILRLRALWPLLPLVGLGYSVLLAERGLWAGPFFTDVHGLAPLARGNALLLLAAAMSLGAIACGPLDQVVRSRKRLVAIGTAVAAACFLALGLVDLSLTAALVVMVLLGAFGMSYSLLMAHGRSFFPDHLLGRGITLMNTLFIGGAGVLQPLSGALMKSYGTPVPAEAYALLHTLFGAGLVLALVTYLFSIEEKRPG